MLDDFIIVCMDNSSGTYTGNQYNLLLEETTKNKPIIIVEYVPLVTGNNIFSELGNCDGYYYIIEGSSIINTKMINLICNNDNIKLVLTGYVHGMTDTEIIEGKHQFTCSSSLMGNVNKIVIK